MDLEVKNRLFLITGASSGLGEGVARALLQEGAEIIAVARNENKLAALNRSFPGQVHSVCADIFKPETAGRLKSVVGNKNLGGLLINASGPPAMTFSETVIDDWDQAYQEILRWKVNMLYTFLPGFISAGYGRILFIESSSVKQPVERLILSNSLRLAVVGMVKTVSQEIAATGVTLNILAPGFHDTPAVERLFSKRASLEKITKEEARRRYKAEIKVGRFGNREEFGALAAWLLSPLSGYITGQTISVDGGFIKGTMG